MKTIMKNRNDFAPLLCEMKLTGFAVEIGVAEGDYSFYLLDRWPGVCFQVDPWKSLPTEEYQDYCNKDVTEMERRYELVARRSRKYNGRSRIMRMYSEDAVEEFSDNFFDFVYIDANHKLEFIRKDIALWWPKVKPGGLLAGHDFLDGVISSGDYGVKTAVTEFANGLNLSVGVTCETSYPSWWIQKP